MTASMRIKEMAQMLANPASRQNPGQEYRRLRRRIPPGGIVVDLEEVPDASQPHFAN